MSTRQLHYFVYNASDIHPDAIALEIYRYSEEYLEDRIPLLYVFRNIGNAARMLEEVTLYQEEVHRIRRMERLSDYFFQVQRTRLVSLEPIDHDRKWGTFRRIVEAYNLGEVGGCSFLSDYIDEKGSYLLEKVYGTKGKHDIGRMKLPGEEKFLAELINRYNQEALKG